MTILGRDQLNPKEPDYKTILTKIKGVSPDALYYGGVQQTAVKLARQAYEVLPQVHKLGLTACPTWLSRSRQGRKRPKAGGPRTPRRTCSLMPRLGVDQHVQDEV